MLNPSVMAAFIPRCLKSVGSACCFCEQEELALLFFLLLAAVVATFFIQHYRILWLPASAAAMSLGIIGGGMAWVMGVPLAAL